ncbi:MAG: hypothetical protein RL885_03105 [Planctomycetota bacterium]
MKGTERWLPLYEAKMIHHFDDYSDRPAGSESTALPDVPVECLQDPTYPILSSYWGPAEEVESRLKDKWPLGWRDTCRSTDARTVIASLIPRVGVGNKYPLILPSNGDPALTLCLAANLTAFVYDYATRQKMGGTTLNYFIFKQLPVPPPEHYRENTPWEPGTPLRDWVASRVLELVYTAEDLRGLAESAGYEGHPSGGTKREDPTSAASSTPPSSTSTASPKKTPPTS